MFELEALLLGIEPLTALAVGVGALALAPLVGVVGSWVEQSSLAPNIEESVSSVKESARDAAKNGLIFVFDAFDKTQGFFAEVGESFQDLIAEAKSDLAASKYDSEESSLRQISIVSE
ncbi:hypothetical protein DO97_01660 [Neosynechococcus sphagnicola sy1]|uniref:DUF5132 domain-containing protein n=1 Tax=Neosynechococcus sphagnicola sy1 TaxID=1497020 RepID=A0A098TMX4_9CYAN|nr:hypothetical protein [Neosynechococcus sphagnicola]KGF73227.1 hypothetical protein DO97_01660 [Neosynechococcus sphagnicola sy1]